MASETPALSFPPQIFKKLSPTSFLLRHLQSSSSPSGPTRPCSRKPKEFRTPTLHTNALSHTHGSAVLRTGDTAVVCGVRGEILSLTNGEGRVKGQITVVRNSELEDDDDGGGGGGDDGEIKRFGLLVPNLELGTGCSRDYHPGPPSDAAQATAERLRSLLLDTTNLIPASTLRILHPLTKEIKAYWVLYIDITAISLDGNVLDTAWASLVAALNSTRLPQAVWDVDSETVVCDPALENMRGLEMKGLAFVSSFAACESDGESWILSDPDEFEERVCEERVVVCIKEGGEVVRIEKGGGLVVQEEGVRDCVERAKERFLEWGSLVKGGCVPMRE